MPPVSKALIKRLDKLQVRANKDVNFACFPPTMDEYEWEGIAIPYMNDLVNGSPAPTHTLTPPCSRCQGQCLSQYP
jgi:hypothetical protein